MLMISHDSENTSLNFDWNAYNFTIKKEFGPVKRIITNLLSKAEGVGDDIYNDCAVFNRQEGNIVFAQVRGREEKIDLTKMDISNGLFGTVYIVPNISDYEPMKITKMRRAEFGNKILPFYREVEESINYWAIYVNHVDKYKDKICAITPVDDRYQPFNLKGFLNLLTEIELEIIAENKGLDIEKEGIMAIASIYNQEINAMKKAEDDKRQKQRDEWEREKNEEKQKAIDTDAAVFDDMVTLAKNNIGKLDWNNINKNVKLKKGGRKAAKSSPAEILKLVKTALKSDEEYDPSYSRNDDEDSVFYHFLVGDSGAANRVNKDLSKIDFDYENCGFSSWGTTDNGINYALCWAGGDWEIPITFAIYYDGKELRGYVPVAGNTYNYVSNEAFGTSEEESNAKFICKEIGIKYTIKCRHEDFLDAINMRDGYELKADDNRIKEDISARLELIS